MESNSSSLVIEAPFPSRRTRRWKPKKDIDRVNAFPPAVSVVFSQEVLVGVDQHLSLSLEYEAGGFLLGNRYCCPNSGRNYVIIDQYSPAKFIESTQINLSFTHEAWAQMSDELSGKFLGKLIIGWYHSHPGMGVFLSTSDLMIHEGRFPEPWMFALVVDPKSHEAGVFGWLNREIDARRVFDFYELFERHSRTSVVTWNNYRAALSSLNRRPLMPK